MKITVVRKEFANDRTFGDMFIDGEFFCNTLEPHVIDWSKQRKVAGKTAIPEGTYKVRLGWSKKSQRIVPWLMRVPHFRDIQIHVGNFPKDTRGCILVGDQDKDVIVNSRVVFDRLMKKLKGEKDIEIEVKRDADANETGGVGVPPAPQVRGNIKTTYERFAMRTGAGETPTPPADDEGDTFDPILEKFL
ncbi:MAG: DUF5675 family protein [Prevotella sp.]